MDFRWADYATSGSLQSVTAVAPGRSLCGEQDGLLGAKLRYNARRGRTGVMAAQTDRKTTVAADTALKDLLGMIELPGIGRPLKDVAALKRVDVEGRSASIGLELKFPAQTRHAEIAELLRERAKAAGDLEVVEVDIEQRIVAHGVQPNLKPLDGVRNIVAVTSGKGGVGKSTTAVNLALALAKDGARVGVLDADIYGPSVPLMLGLVGERPLSEDGKTMAPLEAHGLQVMSIGFLIDPDQPMVWRGPMVTSALNQLLRQTQWNDLDYLIVDMPPGTGDIQLTLSQQVPVSGAVIVTTPQNIALADAVKGLQMFRKVSVPVLGVIENMSVHICSQCGHEDPVFGSDGGQSLAADYDVELLGQLPLDRVIREQTDSGTPTVVASSAGVHADRYSATAQRMAAVLATLGKDYSQRFPKIVVEKSG